MDFLAHNDDESKNSELKQFIEFVKETKNILDNLLCNPSVLIEDYSIGKKEKLLLINELIESSEVFNKTTSFNILFYFQSLENKIVLSDRIYEIGVFFDDFFVKIKEITYEEFNEAYKNISSYLEKN